MEELLRSPTEGYGEAIVLSEINADHFEIKTNLLQLFQAIMVVRVKILMLIIIVSKELPRLYDLGMCLTISNASGMNATSSKTDERIDKLADQLSTLVEIVSKKVVTPAPVKAYKLSTAREVIELENTQNNALAKLPMLKLGEYEMWEIRIKQYFQIQDYALWEVIENGNSWVPIPVTTPSETGTSTATKMTMPSTTEEKTCKKNDVKARSLLLMALPNEHQLTFDQYVDAQSMFAAIKARFGGNEATKKTQKALLKQQYENFSASSSESLDSIFNRLQRLVSRLAILGVVTPPEDLNVKFLRSLPSEWDTHVVVWMNKPDFDTMGLDDLYNNFKIVEQKVKKSAGASNDDKNLAFVTTSGASSTNNINTVNPEVSTATTKVNTASTEISTASFSDATVYAFLSTQPKGSQLVHEDLEQLHDDDLEEMDLKWNMALLSMRARKFYQRTGRKIIIDGSNTAGYDKSKVECFNCHKIGHFARECRAPRSKDNRNWNQGSSSKAVKIEDASEKAMCAIDGAGFDWSDMAEEEIQANMALMAFSDSELDDDCFKASTNKAYAVREEEPKKARENNDAPIIEDWVSDDEDDVEPIPKVEKKTVIPTATKKEFVKPETPLESVRQNVNTVKARGFNAVKPSACWVWKPIKPNGASLSNSQLNDKGFVDSGCSRHMSGNISHLSNFKHFDEGYVTFGGGANGGRITGKEAVSTACYVHNRVLIVKPHNKTPYELFRVNTAKQEVNTGSKEVVLHPPEVNTATPEDLEGPSPASEDSHMEDQEIKLGNIPQSYETGMKTSYSEKGFLSAIYEGKSHQDLHTCLFVCFLSQEEPKRISQALRDPAWVEKKRGPPKNARRNFFIQTAKVQLLRCESLPLLPKNWKAFVFQDGDAADVDEHLYRSRNRIKYLKGKPSLGLWYFKDSPLELVAYTDSDYARATLDRKSTTGGRQFLGNRLISWQCKKQTVVATSTTEAEYVAAASCCGQVLWIQKQLLDYGYNFMDTVIYIDNTSTICIIENPVQHSKTKHIEIRHHFIRDCNAKKLIQMAKIDTQHNVADLLTKGFDAGKF
ncbi:uncharacterized mitochondrial protein-like protein [Tanacetum coccineum]